MNIEHSGVEKDDVFEIFLERIERSSNKRLLESTGKIYRLDQILKALESLNSGISNNIQTSLLQHHGIDLKTGDLLGSGMICKVLGSESPGWKLGRLKVLVHIDFIPDSPQEPEGVNHQENGGASDLDELRKIV